jgi:hypothetical protein
MVDLPALAAVPGEHVERQHRLRLRLRRTRLLRLVSAADGWGPGAVGVSVGRRERSADGVSYSQVLVSFRRKVGGWGVLLAQAAPSSVMDIRMTRPLSLRSTPIEIEGAPPQVRAERGHRAAAIRLLTGKETPQAIAWGLCSVAARSSCLSRLGGDQALGGIACGLEHREYGATSSPG